LNDWKGRTLELLIFKIKAPQECEAWIKRMKDYGYEGKLFLKYH